MFSFYVIPRSTSKEGKAKAKAKLHERSVARLHVTGHQGAFCQYITVKRKISAANCLRPKVEFWQRLEQADDVSKRPVDREQ
jgi:hypothetical protein